ncbi:MAG: hypothetical protein L3J32_11330 [Rhizobiaceae bacterium]|nr:hypothetical protein [Rhizobiaceae bacterium]
MDNGPWTIEGLAKTTDGLEFLQDAGKSVDLPVHYAPIPSLGKAQVLCHYPPTDSR